MMFKRMKCLVVAVFSLSIIFFYNNISAQEHHPATSHETEEKFDPAKEIMGHIRDAYEFHFFTLGHFHATINLPVILYSPQKGWSLFSSSRFGHEGENTYDGYKLENGNIVPVGPGIKVYDFSLTKNVVQMFIAIIVLVLL
ncbi:MAG: F0F1 ATP synthase subunit A, partial [Chitinophagaceae bacterium]|nr:F0F1 ATP synthase subunit A [Chitinophagaceae bacterium]